MLRGCFLGFDGLSFFEGDWLWRMEVSRRGRHVGCPSAVRECPHFGHFRGQMSVIGDRRSSICTAVSGYQVQEVLFERSSSHRPSHKRI
jgi:hypothetical protein